MKAEAFYRLAQKEGACESGLLWLKDWMKENPNKDIGIFFKETKKRHIIFSNLD